MAATADDILKKIMGAAESSFSDGWSAVKQYAPVEFKKMAIQIEEIAANVAKYKVDKKQGYSEETAKLLFSMQRHACESVLVAVTHLTMVAVQKALDAIINVLKNAFKGVIASIL